MSGIIAAARTFSIPAIVQAQPQLLSSSARHSSCGGTVADAASGASSPHGDAVPRAAVRKAIKDAVQKPRGARGGRRASRKLVQGITPEHMMYWVSQADIAAQLRCKDDISAIPGIEVEQMA